MSQEHEEPTETDPRLREPSGDAADSVGTIDQPSETSDQPQDVAARIEEIPAADGALVLAELPADAAADVAEYLDPDTAGAILSEMDPQQAASVLSDMEAPEASLVVAAMAPDDRVDVLEHVSDVQHAAILDEMDAEDAADVRHLEKYAPDSAGGIMTTDVTSLPQDLTIEQAVVHLRRLSEELEQMWYVFVVDERNHLVGVLSIRDLILSAPSRKIRSIMRTQVVTVLATDDQEEVARLFRRYNYLAMPVVDARQRLVGLITFDDVADVIEEEAVEDVQKMFGAGARERIDSAFLPSFRNRVLWLAIKLLAAMIAAALFTRFDGTVASVPALAAFAFLAAAVSGTAAAQSLAVTIHSLLWSGSGDRKASLRSFYRAIYRQSRLGLACGLCIGILAGGAAASGVLGHRIFYPYHPYVLGAIVAAAMLINHVIGTVTGVAIPFVVRRLGGDPSQSATVWTSAVTDSIGVLSTLGFAQACMHWLR